MKNLIFDVGGVIVDEKENRFIQPWVDAADSLGEFTALEKNLVLGTMQTKEVYELVVRKHPKYEESLKKALTMEFYEQTLSIFPEAIEALKLSTEKGYQIYLLSNANDLFRQYVFSVVYPQCAFHGALFSCDVGFEKPDTRIYWCLLKRYDLFAGETMFFDDQSANVYAAGLCGIKAVVVKRGKGLLKAVSSLPPAKK